MPPIRTDGSNAFAHRTVTVRLPAIIRQVQARHPQYPATIQAALDALHDDLLQNAPLPALRYPAPDAEQWALDSVQREAETWHNTQWFFAELYFWRLMMQAVRYFETGLDPFLGFKLDEFYSVTCRTLLHEALHDPQQDQEEALARALLRALWGNRADLSLLIAHRANEASAADLLADERSRVIDHVRRGSGMVHLITDNAGTELALDLALVDVLLRQGIPVMLHLKMYPIFVSDATVHDVWYFISDLIDGKYDEGGSDAPAQLGLRLNAALDEGRLRLAPDFYWCSPRWLDDLPLRLQRTFAGARLVISKGDANYRRIIHDTRHPPETPFADYTRYFPAPLLALRTLKSDGIIGLAPGVAAGLDVASTDWRTSGRYGVIQFKA